VCDSARVTLPAVAAHRASVLAAIVVSLLLSGCRDRSRLRRANHNLAAPEPVMLDGAARDATLEVAPPEAPPRRSDAGTPRVRLDAPIDIGPSAQLAATSDGVLIRTKADDLVWSAFERRKDQPPPASIDAEATSTIPAPAIARESRAYWISHGRLVRRNFSRNASGQANAGPLEVLASDAYDATRVAVRTVDTGTARDLVAYIARPIRPRGDRHARLWVENTTEKDAGEAAGRSFDLSEEGSGASSVALAGIGTRTWAVSLDARVVMSPVHARAIDLIDGNAIRYGQDVVVFVGDAQAAHTDIGLVISGGEPVALFPLPKDVEGFGLARVAVGREPRLDSPAVWTMFPNGVDPALFAVRHLCGNEWVAYVRPTEATANAPSLLVLAPLDGVALGPEIPVATVMHFTSLAFAAGEDMPAAKRKAGWLAWSADGRSWACALRCQ
jgi:hypothetical protein